MAPMTRTMTAAINPKNHFMTCLTPIVVLSTRLSMFFVVYVGLAIAPRIEMTVDYLCNSECLRGDRSPF